MAIYHYHASWVSRKAGQTTLHGLAYIQKTRAKDNRIDRTFDYSKQHAEIKECGTLLPDGAREKYKDKADSDVWNDLEKLEKGKNGNPQEVGRIASRLDFALPNELSQEGKRQLIHDFGMVFVNEGRVFSYGWHDKGDGNDHVDAQVSGRAWNNQKGEWGSKYRWVNALDEHGQPIPNPKAGHGARPFKGKSVLNIYDVVVKRKVWQDFCNAALAKEGVNERIDCRTLQAQRDEQEALSRDALKRGDLQAAEEHALKAASLDREPTKHEFAKRKDGFEHSRNEHSRNPEIVEQNKAIRVRNARKIEARQKEIRKNVARRKHDDYFRKRAKQAKLDRRNSGKLAGIHRDDSKPIKGMEPPSEEQKKEWESILPDPPAKRPAVKSSDRNQAQGHLGFQSLFSKQEQTAAGAREYDVFVFASHKEAASILGCTEKELARRAALVDVKNYEKKNGKISNTYGKRNSILQAGKKARMQDGLVMVCKPRDKQGQPTGARTAAEAVDAVVQCVDATKQVLDSIEGLVGAIPIVGKPLSGFVKVAKSPVDVLDKIGQKVSKAADKAVSTGESKEAQAPKAAPRASGGGSGGRGGSSSPSPSSSHTSSGGAGGGLGSGHVNTDHWIDDALEDWRLKSAAARGDDNVRELMREI